MKSQTTRFSGTRLHFWKGESEQTYIENGRGLGDAVDGSKCGGITLGEEPRHSAYQGRVCETSTSRVE